MDHGLHYSAGIAAEFVVYFWKHNHIPHYFRRALNVRIKVLEVKLLKIKSWNICYQYFKMLHDFARKPCAGARVIVIYICADERYTCKSKAVPVHTTKALGALIIWGAMDIQLHSFVSSTLDESERLASRLSCFFPNKVPTVTLT